MKDLLVILFITIAIICGMLILAIFFNNIGKKGYNSYDEACQYTYGIDYEHIYGNRSPDLCVNTITGEVKYYELIEPIETKTSWERQKSVQQ